MFAVAVFGEALVDLIENGDGTWNAVPGGSPANVAVALSRQRVRTHLVARLAHDRFGEMIRDHVFESGVDLTLVAVAAEPTTMAVVALDDSGSATYSFYVDGCADGAWVAEDIPVTIPADVIVVSGSLALPTSAFGDVMEALLDREYGRRLTVFDPNIRPALIAGRRGKVMSRFDRWITKANVIKASAEDIAWVYPGASKEEVTQTWIDLGVDLAIVTDGDKGAFARTRTATSWCDAPRVDVIDTVGAGDTFTAATVKWLGDNNVLTPEALRLLDEKPLQSLLQSSVQLASETCTRKGADSSWT